VVAFKDYSLGEGIVASPWVHPWYGHFSELFGSPYFGQLLRNTFLLSIYKIVWGTALPLVLALLLNECRLTWMRRWLNRKRPTPTTSFPISGQATTVSRVKSNCRAPNATSGNICCKSRNRASRVSQMPTGVWGWCSNSRAGRPRPLLNSKRLSASIVTRRPGRS